MVVRRSGNDGLLGRIGLIADLIDENLHLRCANPASEAEENGCQGEFEAGNDAPSLNRAVAN